MDSCCSAIGTLNATSSTVTDKSCAIRRIMTVLAYLSPEDGSTGPANIGTGHGVTRTILVNRFFREFALQHLGVRISRETRCFPQIVKDIRTHLGSFYGGDIVPEEVSHHRHEASKTLIQGKFLLTNFFVDSHRKTEGWYRGRGYHRPS